MTLLLCRLTERILVRADPWFNYRATEYLAANGWHAFFHWFDYDSWYPLGRPVGTTIYPGMQISSVAIWKMLAMIGNDMSLNDVCCFVPVWYGVSASIFLGLLTWECSNNKIAAAAAMLIMSIVPVGELTLPPYRDGFRAHLWLSTVTGAHHAVSGRRL